MKRFLLLAGALTVACATAASAAPGVNLTWGSGCYPENPSNTKTFACNTNSGNAQFVASFIPGNDHPAFVGTETVIDLRADDTALPDWWQFFNSGVCRQTSLSVSADFTSAPATSCVDPWSGLAQGGVGAYQTVNTSPQVPNGLANAARLKIFFALADISPLTAGTEYYDARGTINYLKTTGTGSCAGCATGVTLVLNQVRAAENTGPFEDLTDAITNQCLIWNSSTIPCATVPTHNVTWGQVKSLYR